MFLHPAAAAPFDAAGKMILHPAAAAPFDAAERRPHKEMAGSQSLGGSAIPLFRRNEYAVRIYNKDLDRLNLCRSRSSFCSSLCQKRTVGFKPLP
jgi:hypothetical protein